MTIFTRRASGLFAPDPEPLELSPMRFELSGELEVRLYRAKSGTLLNRWRFPNLLVSQYLDAIGTNAGGFPGVGLEPDATNFFSAGTGASTPIASNVALDAEIAGGRCATSIINAFYVAGIPDYCLLERQGTFSTTQANGNIAEFGWHSASAAGSLRARALPKDGSGNPIVIVKNNTQTLVLNWRVRVRYVQADVVLNRNVSGVPYVMTARAIGANIATPASYFIATRGPNWAASLHARTQGGLVARTGSSAAGTGVTGVATAYTPGSYQREMTFTTQAMSAFAFLTNCGGTANDQFCTLQIGFAPALPAGQPLKVTVGWAPV